MRTAEICRKTSETDITLVLNIDGRGESNISSGSGFMDHMLALFSKHGRFDLTVSCKGDTEVDFHHTVEDIGISLGMAFSEALGEKRGINRYGNFILPMDEALILTAVDFSGRGYLGFDVQIPSEWVGFFDTELLEEFWQAFVRSSGCTLHIRKLSGSNSHHIIEGTFKSTARSIRDAVIVDSECSDEIPSTKGVL